MFKYYRYQVTEKQDRSELLPLLRQIAGDHCDIEIYLKKQPASTVWPVDFRSQRLVVKRYNDQGFVHACKRAFRRSRAENCYTVSRRFARAGIAVAEPLATIQEWWGPIRLRAWYICEMVQGEMLRDLYADRHQRGIDKEENTAITREVDGLFARLREHRLSHGDLKASNIVWAQGRLFLIDLDVARAHTSDHAFERAHARDRARFMKNWRDRPLARKQFAPLLE